MFVGAVKQPINADPMKASKYILFALAVFLLFGCEGDDNTICGVQDPVNELPWLRAEIESVETVDLGYDYIIYQGVYEHRTIFISSICCPFCLTTAPIVKTCSGKNIGHVGVDVAYEVLDRAKVVWRTNKGVCP